MILYRYKVRKRKRWGKEWQITYCLDRHQRKISEITRNGWIRLRWILRKQYPAMIMMNASDFCQWRSSKMRKQPSEGRRWIIRKIWENKEKSYDGFGSGMTEEKRLRHSFNYNAYDRQVWKKFYTGWSFLVEREKEVWYNIIMWK